ncbi:cytochrome P450 4C1-like [Phymastichus coffea]|uniref:cytochrome P450 4C1-like n=1 Tax=Phymastichus coffea TaxID=108790 RepID=UPI00273A7EF2|nr:cytochrome P450 4C1-like [Phymastichus coffea]
MLIEISIGFIVLLCIFEYFTKHGRTGRYLSEIPGPSAWPILGSLPHFIFPRLATPETIWKIGRAWDTKYYPIYKFWSVHKVVAVLLHPDDIEKLFTSIKHSEKSVLYDPLHGWLRTGLLTSHGAKWQKRRKMLTPAFHFAVLQQYFKSIVETGEKTIQDLISKGEAIYDVTDLVADHTLKVICDTAMGYKFDDKDFLIKYRDAIHYLGQCLVYRILNPWFLPESIFCLTERGRKYKEALNTLHTFTRKIIKERKEFHERTDGHFLNELLPSSSQGSSVDVEYHGYRKKRLAMLDLLIAAQRDGGQIDDVGIQEEVDTFTFEGHDTSAAALTFAMLLLAGHKDAQGRIRAEVSAILERTGGKLGIAEVQRFAYLEMCLRECLRLYPSVQYLSRHTPEDLQLASHLIPAGTIIFVNVYSVHRAAEFWPDPDKFDPERFSPENCNGRHPFAYIPFSAGHRNCIGQKFAMMELKAFLAHLIYHFYLEPVDRVKDVPILADIVIRPARSIRVKLVPIEK